MSDLPREMEEEVLSRLPVTSLRDLRSTSKEEAEEVGDDAGA